MRDVVELTIPIKADLIVLARLTAATVASRAGFDVEEIEDLRLAVDELCVSLVSEQPDGQYHLTFVRDDGGVEVTCTVAEEATPPGSALSAGSSNDLSARILDALVDEHGQEQIDGGRRAWLRKGRARPEV